MSFAGEEWSIVLGYSIRRDQVKTHMSWWCLSPLTAAVACRSTARHNGAHSPTAQGRPRNATPASHVPLISAGALRGRVLVARGDHCRNTLLTDEWQIKGHGR